MNVLSVQSHTAAGHVGNDAATFCLERMGFPVINVHTLQFSNHTGHAFTGEVFSAKHLSNVIDGVENFCGFAHCGAVLSGYLGASETGDVVLDAVKRVKAANPNALYCCDTVMGDKEGGLFVKPEIADFFMRKALPAADILTPNVFELEILSKTPLTSFDKIVRAAENLRKENGIATLAVTSVKDGEDGANETGVLVCANDGAYIVKTPQIPFSKALTGTGDMFAAVFLARVLQEKSTADAVSLAVSSLFGIIQKTAQNNEREAALVQAQDELVAPQNLFSARRLF